jgi:hypothetical protein
LWNLNKEKDNGSFERIRGETLSVNTGPAQLEVLAQAG